MGPRGLGPYVNIMDVLCIKKKLYSHPGHCHGPSKCGPYGPQGPWAQPLFEPVAELFRFFFRILGVPKIKNAMFHENSCIFVRMFAILANVG